MAEKQDAIALLKADHREVEELFEQFEKATGDGRKQKIAEQICLELSVHSSIEEEIFYPAWWKRTCSRNPMSSTTGRRC